MHIPISRNSLLYHPHLVELSSTVTGESHVQITEFVREHHNRILDGRSQIDEYHLKLQDVRRSEHIGYVGIGSPRQMLKVIFDTGSSNFWVMSDACQTEQCSRIPHFRRDKSSTYKPTKYSMKVKYAGSPVVGKIVKETVSFGPIVVREQAVALVSSDPGRVYEKARYSGIIGMSFASLSVLKSEKVFLDQIQEQKILTKNQFSFFLHGRTDGTSYLIFGEPEPNVFSRGPTFWVPVTRKMYWEVSVQKFSIGSPSSIDDFCSEENPCATIVDSGTSFITAPTKAVEAILTDLPKLKIDCSNVHEFPNLKIQMNAIVFELEPAYYISQNVHQGNLSCALRILTINIPPPRGPVFILGDIFMKKYFTTFDRDLDRIGFAVSQDMPWTFAAPYSL